MPFSEEFLSHASRAVAVKTLEQDFQTVRAFIDKAVSNIAKATAAFSPRDVEVYLHGSYANSTNIYFPSDLEIAVELKRTVEFDATQSNKTANLEIADYRVLKNYFVEIELEFGPKQFRDLLYLELQKMLGTKCTDKDKTILFPNVATVKHEVAIMPCFSFKYFDQTGESFKGVLLYDYSEAANIVTFPKLHAENGRAKDIACGGNFKKCVRLFKTLNALNVKEFELLEKRTATGYFIECLLYNVPNSLFRGRNMRTVFTKVMNFLMNCDMSPFVCQNLVWHLFGNAREFWQEKRAEDFLQSIYSLWRNFPPSRVHIA